MDVTDDLARRIRAAIALGGFKGVPDLARNLNAPGLGEDNLYLMLGGKREIAPHELREVARVCGVPYEFFTADLGKLADAAGPDLEARVNEEVGRRTTMLDQQLEKIWAQLQELAAARSDLVGATPPVGAEPPQPPGELGRRLSTPQTSDERQPQHETPPAAARGRDSGG